MTVLLIVLSDGSEDKRKKLQASTQFVLVLPTHTLHDMICKLCVSNRRSPWFMSRALYGDFKKMFKCSTDTVGKRGVSSSADLFFFFFPPGVNAQPTPRGPGCLSRDPTAWSRDTGGLTHAPSIVLAVKTSAPRFVCRSLVYVLAMKKTRWLGVGGGKDLHLVLN